MALAHIDWSDRAAVATGDVSARPRPTTPRPLRILTVVSEGPPIASGIARTIQHLQDGLRRRGHHVDVVSHPRVPRVALGEIRLSGLLFELGGLASSIDAYDVVHVHGAAPTFSDVFLAYSRLRRRHPQIVYTHHCDIEVGPQPLRELYRRVHHWLSGHADEIVSTSAHYAAELGEDRNVSVIPLGVDVDHFEQAGAKDDQFTVLFVGQFRPYKGVRVLLKALAGVHGCRLLVAGHGPEEAEYRRLAADLGLDVEFHVGADDEQIRALYRRAHVIALPSVTRAEAFGLVLLEGMAAGCVPVASDLPGVRSVLGRIGFTFPVGSVSGLAATIRQLRDDPELIEQIGRRARDRARQFSWDRTVLDYERLFLSLITARDLRRRLDVGGPSAHPLEPFARDVGAMLAAERVELLVPGDGADLAVAAATAPPETGQPSLELLARYALNTGESALLSEVNAPRGIPSPAGGHESAALAVPLLDRGRPFAVLAAVRDEPFDQRDLDALTRLARHCAPSVVASLARSGPRRRVGSVAAASGQIAELAG